jgi:hypothetical protein
LKVAKLRREHLRRYKLIRLQRTLQLRTLFSTQLRVQPFAKFFQRCATVIKIRTREPDVVEVQTVNWIMLQHVHPDVVDVIAHFRISGAGVNTFQLAAIRFRPFHYLLTKRGIARRHVVELGGNRLGNSQPLGMFVVNVRGI